MIVGTKDESCNAVTKYPKLMIASNNEVVLFSGPSAGVLVVAVEESLVSVGTFSKIWLMRNFTLYTGEVTLKNG
jgi:type IV secretory pathway TrbD component